MEQTIEVLRWVSAGAYAGLAVVVLAGWIRRRERSAAWAAAAFGLLAAVAVAARIIPQEPDAVTAWTFKLLLGGVILFPYLLFRFAASFRDPRRVVSIAALSLTVLTLAATVALPELPSPDDPTPWWIQTWVFLLLGQWTFLFAAVAGRLWRSGRGEPAVARRRMRMLALAAVGVNLVILVSGLAPDPQTPDVVLATQVVGLVAVVLFYLGLNPPRALRDVWRRREEEELRRVVAELVSAGRPEEVLAALMPHAAALTAARGVTFVDHEERVVTSLGEVETDNGHRSVAIPMRTGRLNVTASPYTPFFGEDELNILRYLGSLADLAIARTRALERERSFISNAAHELRTPMTVLTGFASTLAASRHRMSETDIDEAFGALDRQGERARALVSNLLDLARLEQDREQLTLQPVDAMDVARSAAHTVEQAEGVSVELRGEAGVMARSDEQRLHQMLVNLLLNAARHGRPPITLTISPRGEVIDVVVEDGGDGVSESVVPAMFEAFTQGADVQGRGSGLGLAIVQRLARASAGRIRYERATPSGARFILTLGRVP